MKSGENFYWFPAGKEKMPEKGRPTACKKEGSHTEDGAGKIEKKAALFCTAAAGPPGILFLLGRRRGFFGQAGKKQRQQQAQHHPGRKGRQPDICIGQKRGGAIAIDHKLGIF